MKKFDDFLSEELVLTPDQWAQIRGAAEMYADQFRNTKTINTKYHLDVSEVLSKISEVNEAANRLMAKIV